ncbi:hypothetical protein Tco_0745348, partial [Tanacetum coccineum]
LDEYAFRNKIIESKTTETNKTVGTTNEATIVKPKSVNETVVSKSKINRDEVIIEDWTSDDEDDVCAVKTVSIVRPLALRIAQSNSVVRPNHPRLDIVRPKASNSPIKRSYFTHPVYKPKDLKPDVKTFGVKNMTTVGTRAVVSKGKVENVLKKAKWVWRPKMNYQDHVYKYNGSYMLKKFEEQIPAFDFHPSHPSHRNLLIIEEGEDCQHVKWPWGLRDEVSGRWEECFFFLGLIGVAGKESRVNQVNEN